jgi:hypothetical protein
MSLLDAIRRQLLGQAAMMQTGQGMGGATQGLLGQGGQMGGGLLQSNLSQMNQGEGGILSNIPQAALLGSAIFSQGVQGKDPFSALLPAVVQTSQIQSLLSQTQEQERKKKYINKYGETIPEGNERDLFNLDPASYIKNKLSEKKPDLINMIGGDQKTPITLNLSNKEDLEKFRQLKSEGFYEVGKPTVQAQSLEGLSNVPKATLTEAGKKLMGAEELQVTLSTMENLFEPEFLTYVGKGKKFVSDTLSKAGYSNEQIDSFSQRKAVWDQSVEQYFNQYRKLITGVAAGEKEIGFLEKSIPSKGDAPNVFLAKVRLQQKLNNKIIERSNRYLQGGGVKTLNKDREPTGAYKDYLEKNPIQVERDDVLSITQEYKNMGYQPKQIEFQLNQQFGNEWKKFFE